MSSKNTVASQNKRLFFDLLDGLQEPKNETETILYSSSNFLKTRSGSSLAPMDRVDDSARGDAFRSSNESDATRTIGEEDLLPRARKRRKTAQDVQKGADDVSRQEVIEIEDSSPKDLQPSSSHQFINTSENVRSSEETPKHSIPVTGKAKKPCKIKPKPPKQQIFHGFIFFFFPNNDIHPARRARIILAIEYGAVWLRDWHISVTHIVVDQSVKVEEVLKHLKLDELPKGVIAVNDRWQSDSIEWQALENPERNRYRISGSRLNPIADHSVTSTQTVTEIVPPNASTNNDHDKGSSHHELQGVIYQDPLHSLHIPLLHPPEANPDDMYQPNDTRCEEGDQLQQAIAEAKTLEHLPLDSDSESEDSSKVKERSKPENHVTDLDARSAQHQTDVSQQKAIPKWQQRFACMRGSALIETCVNGKTVDILQKMANYYESVHDVWRPIAYRKAITSLKNHPSLITSRGEAERLPNIGVRLAQKIEEIFWTNRLRRLEATKAEVTDLALQMFLQIYGVGCSQATRWVQQGFRTLDDLTAHGALTDNQKIGVAHFKDFQSRIPRSEVAEIGRYVTDNLLRIDPKFQVTIGGSYRRGAKDSGDVDLIISKPGVAVAEIRTIVLETLVPQLATQGFIKATLAETSQDRGTKWHGACILPDCRNNNAAWRRIDLLLVPWEEIGAARLYFTGNNIFNRSIRLLASKKGMRLNQRGLYRDVIRGPGRQKLTEGVKIEGENEQRIFEILGVPWREPEDRNC